MAANVWSSERLIYRVCETDDEAFLESLNQDPLAYTQAAPFLPAPQGKKAATGFREWLNGSLLGVIVCLPAPAPSAAGSAADAVPSKPIPIGVVSLSAPDPRQPQHKHSMFGINFAKAYHGQGYGSEAIRWTLWWGFMFANLHRIELGAFAFNTGAVRLYERLGFVLEGRKREHLWFNGRYWDELGFAMLENEWRARYGGKQEPALDAPDSHA